jgi:hypothetical protein
VIRIVPALIAILVALQAVQAAEMKFYHLSTL